MQSSRVFNPTLGKATPGINPLPLSARISKPDPRDVPDSINEERNNVNETTLPLGGTRSSHIIQSRRAISCNRALYNSDSRLNKVSKNDRAKRKSYLPCLRIDTSMANQCPVYSVSTSRRSFSLRMTKTRGLNYTRGKPCARKHPSVSTRATTQAPIDYSFSDHVRIKARFGHWLEQWEARKIMAAEIEWREDRELLEKGLSTELLLEMKVKQRGLTSDALMYAQHIMRHKSATTPPFDSYRHVPIYTPGSIAGCKISQHNSGSVNALLTPCDSVAGSATTVGSREPISAGQDLLSTLLTPDSEFFGRTFFANPTSATAQSHSESSAESRFLDSLGSELMEAQRQTYNPIAASKLEIIEKRQRRVDPVIQPW